MRLLSKLIDKIDIYLARTGLIMGALLALISGLREQSFVSHGLLVFTASALYLLYIYIRKRREKPNKEEQGLPRTLFLTLTIVFIFSLTACILLARNADHIVPLPYYILAAISFGIIAFQVLMMKEDQKNVLYISLIELLVICLMVRLIPVYSYHGLVGVDPWINSALHQDILNYGYIPEHWVYSSFPLFHTEIAAFQLVTGLSFKDSLVWSIGLAEVLSLVFVFLFAKILGGNKVALLAALFLGFNEFHMEWGGQSLIAMSLGVVYFSFFIYLLMKTWETKSNVLHVLLILIMVCLVLTHTLASLIAAISLATFYIGFRGHELIFRGKTPSSRPTVTLTLTFLFTVLMVGYWMYASGFFFIIGRSITYALDVIARELVVPVVETTHEYLGEQIIETAKFRILIVLLMLGALFWVSKRFRKPERTMFLLLAGILLAVPQVSDYLRIDVLAPDRWWVFYYLILSVPVAFLLVEGSQILKAAGKLAIGTVLAVLAFMMLVSPLANIDSQFYHSDARYAFLDSELAAVETIKGANEGTIVTDLHYGSLLLWGGKYGYPVLQLDDRVFEEGGYGQSSLYLVRQYIIDYFLPTIDPTIHGEVGYSGKPLYIGEDIFQHFEEGPYNKIYDNGTVWGYR